MMTLKDFYAHDEAKTHMGAREADGIPPSSFAIVEGPVTKVGETMRGTPYILIRIGMVSVLAILRYSYSQGSIGFHNRGASVDMPKIGDILQVLVEHRDAYHVGPVVDGEDPLERDMRPEVAIAYLAF